MQLSQVSCLCMRQRTNVFPDLCRLPIRSFIDNQRETVGFSYNDTEAILTNLLSALVMEIISRI